MKHMNMAAQRLFGAKHKKRITELPQQQKYMLIALTKFAGETEVRRQIPTQNGYNMCKDFFRKHQLGGGGQGRLSWEDFQNGMEVLESHGLAKLVRHKTNSHEGNFTLQLGYADIKSALQGTALFETLLDADVDCPEARASRAQVEAGSNNTGHN